MIGLVHKVVDTTALLYFELWELCVGLDGFL